MKKKSVSFVTSDKVGEAKQPKKEKNYIKFDIKESNYACFIEQRGQRSK